jgi:hypothetical protein
MDKLTKEGLKEAATILLSPVSLVLIAMTYILSVYASIFSTSKTFEIAALLTCCMMVICAIGWANYIYQQLIIVKLNKLDKKLIEWMDKPTK